MILEYMSFDNMLYIVSDLSIFDAVTVNCSTQSWDVQVNMNVVQHIYPGAMSTNMYLGKLTCTGMDYGQLVIFTYGLRECFTSEIVNTK